MCIFLLAPRRRNAEFLSDLYLTLGVQKQHRMYREEMGREGKEEDGEGAKGWEKEGGRKGEG